MKISALGIHPLAGCYPPLTDDEKAALADSIKEHGQRVPIVITQNHEVLDGRHRVEALESLGIDEVFADTVETPDDPRALISLVRSYNENRRHLNPRERAAMAVKMFKAMGLEPRRGAGRPRREIPSGDGIISDGEHTTSADPTFGVPEIAAAADVSPKTAERAINGSQITIGGTISPAEARRKKRRHEAQVREQEAREGWQLADEYAEKIKGLGESIDERDERISALEAAVKEKDETIEALEARIVELNEQIALLTA